MCTKTRRIPFSTIIFLLIFISDGSVKISNASTNCTSTPIKTPELTSITAVTSNVSDLKSDPSSNTNAQDETTIFVSIFALIIFLILSSNILVIVTIVKHKELRVSNAYILLLSLVIARTAIGALVVPSAISMFYSEEALGSYFCRICHYAGWTSACASVLTIVFIALDKLRSVTYQEKPPLTKKQLIAGLVVVWISALAYAVRMLVMYDMVLVSKPSQPIKYSCHFHPQFHEDARRMFIVDFVLLYTIPLFIIVYTYANVVSALKKKMSMKELDKKSGMRLIQMLTVLMALFAFCNLPREIFILYKYYGGPLFPRSRTVSMTFSALAFSNSWINVIVFFTFRDELREKCMSMLGFVKLQEECEKKSEPKSKNNETQK